MLVWENGAALTVTPRDGQSVLETLRENGFYMTAVCGGRGVCGKCAVRVTQNAAVPTQEEQLFFTDTQITEGWRLACVSPASDNMEIVMDTQNIRDERQSFQALDVYATDIGLNEANNAKTPDRTTKMESRFAMRNVAFGNGQSLDHALAAQTTLPLPLLRKLSQYTEQNECYVLTDGTHVLDIFPEGDGDTASGAYGLAVDIGTTTIAFELVRLPSGMRVQTYATVNRQRLLGADVVTRIQLAEQGKQSALHAYIIEDIKHGIARICTMADIQTTQIRTVHMAGNTTMLHLLLDIPCASLGRFPFTPVFTGCVRYPFETVFGSGLCDCDVTLLPGVSAYVGADITAGIVFCGGLRHERPCLLVDLGTNGEMALFWKERVTVTSTAAGPAFEAGNISRGMGSVPGAIAKVSYDPKENVYKYETIGGVPPAGLCGTGVVDTAAQLVKHGFVDETGLFDDDYFDDGIMIAPEAHIMFTQKDMREIQLAKSAVRSGLELLLLTAGLGYGDIDRLYLAGGFGHKIDLDSACLLGVIPAELRGKVTAVGNSALGGCTHTLFDAQAEREINAVADMAVEIGLSSDPRFNDLFMQHMMFMDLE